MRRVASIFLPMWPIDLIRRRQRERNEEATREKGEAVQALPAQSSPSRHVVSSALHVSQPILLIALERGVQIVKHRCEYAARAGVTPGMTLAHARALLHDSRCCVADFDPRCDEQMLRKLAMWAQRYSPIVAPDPPDGLLLDITGCEQVHGGEPRLARLIIRDLNRLGFHAQVAIASTFACAAAVARVKPLRIFDIRVPATAELRHPWLISIIPSGHERSALAPLPLAALRLDQSVIDALHEVEIMNIGQLFGLPRAQLADRFGETLLLRLDQALGEGGAMEAIEPVRLKSPPRAEHIFDGPVLQIEGIEIMTHALLEQLAVQLLKLERGVCKLDVEFKRIDAPPMRFSVRLSHPSRNVKHLWSLLKPKIEKLNLGFGVEEIALTASRSRILSHQQGEMEPQINADAHGWNERRMIMRCRAPNYHPVFRSPFHSIETGEFIDTLCNRLGADRVLRAEPYESYVPERSTRFHSALDAERPTPGFAESAGNALCEFDRPTLLLPRPEAITVQLNHEIPAQLNWNGVASALTHCIGPEAIASEWWKESSSILREYYKVQNEWGNWLWIYYEYCTGQWFIHGVWA